MQRCQTEGFTPVRQMPSLDGNSFNLPLQSNISHSQWMLPLKMGLRKKGSAAGKQK